MPSKKTLFALVRGDHVAAHERKNKISGGGLPPQTRTA